MVIHSIKRVLTWLLIACVSSAASAVLAASAPFYHVADLGTLGGSTSSAHGISDSGTVVGSSTDSTGKAYPFYYDTSMHKMAIPAANTNGVAFDINAGGEIVGCSHGVSSSIPFLYSPNSGGGTTNMSFPPSTSTKPYGINEYGSVVGYFTQSDGSIRAFIWRPTQKWGISGSTVNLGVLPGGHDSIAQDINAFGTIVGTSYAMDGLIHAVSWSPDVQNGTVFIKRDLGILPNCYGSGANAINDGGETVGWAHIGPNATSAKHAVKFGVLGTPQDLGALAGYPNSVASDINASGTIVGYASSANGSDTRALIHKDGVLYDINACLDCYSTDWTVISASAINSSGAISATAINSDGQTRAVRLDPAPDYSVPVITAVSPNTAPKGSNTLTITITGSRFVPCSQVVWNGNSIQTTFVSATELTAAVSRSLLSAAGEYPVAVFTPAPGGGLSEALPFTVYSPNTAPHAVNDSKSTPVNTPVDISVLANDWDSDEGDTISVTSVAKPLHGASTIIAGGKIHYVPVNGFEGADTFTYTISDSQGALSTATITVTVGRDTEAPVFDSVNAFPTMVAAGDAMSVDAYVTDNVAVTRVTANGTALYDYGEGYWSGSVAATSSLGWNSILVEAWDAANNYATGSIAYRTVPVVGINGRSLWDPIMSDACENFLFVVYGVVYVTNEHEFTITDSCLRSLRVEATGHNLKSGAFARIRGRLFRFDPGNVYFFVYNPARDISVLRPAPGA